VTATFAQGIPASDANSNPLPVLCFTDSNGVVLVAYANFVFSPNTLNVGGIASSSGLQSSYAGGIAYTVSGVSNLLVSLQEPNNEIQVCGNSCEIDVSQSSSNSVTCNLPPLTTTYSAQTYTISEPGQMAGSWAASNGTSLSNVLDGNWVS
jgi:hypothetical protein